MKSIDTTNIYSNAFGDQYFQQINHTAFDNVGSSATFNRIFNEMLDQEKTLYIIVGSDSGLLIPYIQKYHADKGRHYLFLETPEMIEYIEDNIEVDSDLIDVEAYDAPLHEILDKHIHYTTHQRYKLLRSLGVIDGYCDIYKEIWEDINERFTLYNQSEIGVFVNNIFVDSQLRNVALNYLPTANIKNYLKSYTSIILGGGPTLDDNIDWIRDNQEYLIIFAAARIANRLRKEKIQPDFFVSVDPNDVSYDNSKGILENTENAILVNANNVNSKILAEWPGKSAYLGNTYPWMDSNHFQKDNLNIFGPTVTNTMTSVAAYLGSKQVIFSGVDFCHSASGKTHESSSLESQSGKFTREANIRVETYSGRIAGTTPAFANAKSAMENLVEVAEQTFGNTFFSIGLESAKLDRVSYQQVENIELPKQTKLKVMDSIHQTLEFDMNKYKKHLKLAKGYCQEIRNICRDATKLSKEGKKYAKKLFKDLSETDYLTQKLINIKDELDQTLGEHAEFVFNYSIKSYKDFMDPSIDNEDMDKDEIKSSFIHYFDGMIQSSTPLKQSIEDAIRRINHRMEETKGTKSFNKLIEGWNAFDEPGRTRVWLAMNGLTLDDLNPEQRNEVNNLLDTFQKELARTETKLSADIKSSGSNPRFLYNQLLQFFREQRETELAELVNYIKEKSDEEELKLQSEPEEASKENPGDSDNQFKHLHFLGSGFLYEMQGMPDEALDAYVQVNDKRILVTALGQIVNITLSKKDYENALNALEVLTHFSDEYYIAYADIMAAINQGADAVAIYSHYLEKHEDDTAAWIKLAKLLIHLNILDEALKIIDKIKELEPDNTIANELISLINNKQ
ncbi:6-hydroxymethylpterin diphosphokinase MptE-like protein [Hydrogenovibrio kuenenii]|uniref:6-hydroxymethylpterin diphosphokinase MptE-like protein n=1 Tax=Hydrogenovibrio kuenenii TaxID=63658 RepID=UPI000467A1CD|nr:6-hydroxymethylpterin diphosphokinase MptE-like protein [Hydrogenovibrio kuenenii]